MPEFRKISTKILFILLLFLLLIPHPTFAKNIANTTLNDYVEEQRALNECADEGENCISNQNITQHSTINMMAGVSDMIVKLDTEASEEEARNTALGNLAYGMRLMYENPPASGVNYVAHLIDNSGIVKPAYAQGIGFVGVLPFLPFWTVARNVSYSVLVILMVAVGFMIIFRVKIDPKTVISIQAAVPKIIVTLLLITFSYAIVGFMIDLMYVLTALVIYILASGMGGTVGGMELGEIQNKYMNSGVGDLFVGTFWPMGHVLWTFIKELAVSGGLGGTAGPVIGHIFGGMGGGAAFIPWLAGGLVLPTVIIAFVIILGLLFTFIRLFMLLLNSYIQLIINLILAPIILLPEAIPGRSAFGQWMLNIMANLIVFPATIMIILFAVFLSSQGQIDVPSFSPPFLGKLTPGGTFHAILGLGVIFLAPQLVAQIKKMFKPKPTLPITAGTAFAPLTGGVQTVMGAGSQFYYLQHTPIIGNLLGKISGNKPQHP